MKLRRQPKIVRQRVIKEDQAPPPQAFSYTANAPRQPGAANAATRQKPGHFWLQRIGLLIFLVAATASAVNVLSLSPMAKVKTINSGGSQSFLRPDSEYAAAVNHILASSPWNRNKITVDTSAVSRFFPPLEDSSLGISPK